MLTFQILALTVVGGPTRPHKFEVTGLGRVVKLRSSADLEDILQPNRIARVSRLYPLMIELTDKLLIMDHRLGIIWLRLLWHRRARQLTSEDSASSS